MEIANVDAMDIWPPYLVLKNTSNEGINFGLFGSGSDVTRWVLIGIGVIIVLGLLIWFRKGKGFWLQAAVGLVVGGAIGNIFDRLLDGAVVDFLNMSCCGIYNPYVFNVADISIFIGAVGLVFLDGKQSRKKKR